MFGLSSRWSPWQRSECAAVTWSTILQMARLTSTLPITSWAVQTTRPCRLRDNTPGRYFRGTEMIIELLRRRGENRENSIVWSGHTVPAHLFPVGGGRACGCVWARTWWGRVWSPGPWWPGSAAPWCGASGPGTEPASAGSGAARRAGAGAGEAAPCDSGPWSRVRGPGGHRTRGSRVSLSAEWTRSPQCSQHWCSSVVRETLLNTWHSHGAYFTESFSRHLCLMMSGWDAFWHQHAALAPVRGAAGWRLSSLGPGSARAGRIQQRDTAMSPQRINQI